MPRKPEVLAAYRADKAKPFPHVLALMLCVSLLSAPQSPGGTGTIVGRVTDSLANPAANWPVAIRSMEPPLLRATKTQLDGSYRFADLPAGAFVLTIPPVVAFNGVRRTGIVVSSGTIAAFDWNATLGERCQCISIVPAPPQIEPGHVEGRISDLEGLPIPFATLGVNDSLPYGYADIGGRYRFGAAGRFVLTASFPGFETGSQSVEVSSGTNVVLDMRLTPLGVRAVQPTAVLDQPLRWFEGCRCGDPGGFDPLGSDGVLTVSARRGR